MVTQSFSDPAATAVIAIIIVTVLSIIVSLAAITFKSLVSKRRPTYSNGILFSKQVKRQWHKRSKNQSSFKS